MKVFVVFINMHVLIYDISGGFKLEKLFASTRRIRILKNLWKNGETNIMALVRQTNSTWSEVDRNIKFLENLGIVESRCKKNQRLIKLKKKCDTAETVIKALQLLEMANLDQLIV